MSDAIHHDGIPYYELGGEGPPLHLAHANGYPPPSYRQMVGELKRDFRVIAMRSRPLRSDAEPDELETWHVLADDLLQLLDEHELTDVVGVGHSLGGVITMYAALAEPERFRCLVLIEPVFLDPELLGGVADPETAAERIGLVQIARKRRDRWPSRADAFAHFRDKRVFERMDDDALWDYVRAATRPVGVAEASPATVRQPQAVGDHRDDDLSESGPVTLVCPREWEARIYSTPPIDVWSKVPQLRVPTLAVRGAATDTISEASWARWQSLQPDAVFVEYPDVGHLLPFEIPRRLGRLVNAFAAEHAGPPH